MADLTWAQTVISGAVGGALTLLGQVLVTLRETKAQAEAREATRTEAVYDRRLTYELEHLEELRQALLEADDVANDGRRLRRQRKLANSPSFSILKLAESFDEPLDQARAERFGPAMVGLRSAVSVTLDDDVRTAATAAYRYLDSGDSDVKRPVGAALDAIGQRLRRIQGKV
ncbi:hypothetical protein ACOCJ7_07190 [Knoellia sp. CPCC 206453]|uniref:hypothetical protein n=1 Tax=Knoellia pratensis TaxID=3404796 RepID=UPI00360D3360